MMTDTPPALPNLFTTVQVQVRYVECDPMNIAHHSVYPVWMEIARTELLREQGVAYGELEARGIHFVVARMSLRYHRPARYDDLLSIRVEAVRHAGVKIEHVYEIRRGDELLAKAETTLACVDDAGRLRPVTDALPGVVVKQA